MVIIFVSQVVWVRMLMSVFGVRTFAVSIVLAAGAALWAIHHPIAPPIRSAN